MKIKSALVAVLILLASIIVQAEGPQMPPQSDSPEKTKPLANLDTQAPAEPQPAIRSDLASIMFFIGRWEGLVSIWVNGKTSIVNYNVDWTLAPGGKALYSDELIIHPEFGKLTRQNVVEYIEKTGRLRIIRTNYDGKIRIYSGSWIAANRFQYVVEETIPAGKFVEKVDFHVFADSNRADIYQIGTLNGERIEVDSGYFAKR